MVRVAGGHCLESGRCCSNARSERLDLLILVISIGFAGMLVGAVRLEDAMARRGEMPPPGELDSVASADQANGHEARG
jgi:hypothetical protein